MQILINNIIAYFHKWKGVGGQNGGGIVKKKIDTLSKPVFLCLDILKTEIQETVENKPVFDSDFHTELIIKDDFEDLDSGNFDFC